MSYKTLALKRNKYTGEMLINVVLGDDTEKNKIFVLDKSSSFRSANMQTIS